MLETALVAARDRARLTEIALVLFRFEVDGLVAQLGLRNLVLHPHKTTQEDHGDVSLPDRLRLALDAMSPTFIKLRQILATRHDLLSPDWTSELAQLHNHVHPLPWESIHQQLKDDLAAEPEHVFAQFDHQPLASASIAQGYRACLHSGAEGVVKVQRPQ